MTCKVIENPDDFDLEALKRRYAQERDRRIKPEADTQYIEVSEDFADFYEVDPWSPPVERDPISEDIEVAILGGGFAGLLSAYHVQKEGVTDFRIIEMGGDFGGTWYWNRYPGVQCDVESYCYVPLLEETGYVPKEKYSYGPEIYEQCQRIARQFGFYEKAFFGTMVRALRWNEDTHRWHIATNRGDDIRARFLILGSGPYNRPKLPGIPGIESFAGHTFHTSRWDFDYTGGDTKGGLTKLADKTVAVIGTGATGIQCIPYIGRHAKHLYVLQRTPSAVDIRGNRPTDADFLASLHPGWQRERQENLHHATFSGFPVGHPDFVCDGWTEINRNVAAILATEEGKALTSEQVLTLREREDYKYQERVRRRVDEIVTDEATAEKLKAWYRYLCKRPTFNDEYLPTFNRDTVTLIDVSGSRGVERITERGFVSDGVEYPVDCIVFASGFEITTEVKRRIGIPILEGRDGRSLYDHWKDGFRTLHGMTTHGFPNLFFMGFIQGGVSVNVSSMYDRQAQHIAHMIRATRDRGATAMEPTEEAQDRWVRTMRETEVSMVEFFSACTPGYYNNEGSSTFRSHLGEQYGPGFYAFQDLLKDWRASNELEGVRLSVPS